jgi:hypothetical protein
MKHFLILAGTVLLLAVLLCACAPPSTPTAGSTAPSPTASSLPATVIPPSEDTISGTVLDPEGAPLAQATVRIQATTNQTLSDDEGRYVLTGLEQGAPLTISAWKAGFYCAMVAGVTPPASGITFSMRLIQTNDNPNYQWIPPTGENSCYSCKPGVTQVWLDNDAHGKSATNIRFLTMFNGTDLSGNRSAQTRFAFNRDYGLTPLLPDPSQPYYGPGYVLDFPNTSGNCAACHIPGAAVEAPYGIDPNTVRGVNAFGVHCDYCHKVADVKLDPATGLPYPNMPGVLSQDIRRPFPEDEQRYSLFFGSFDDDNVPMEDTYLPLIQESQWCAPCHYGVFWNTVVYNSFGEWLASPYSDPVTGKTCQQCHMPAPTTFNDQAITNVAPDKGGVERDPLTIPAHTFPGASSTDLLQNALTMSVEARYVGNQIMVDVTLVNDQTGHHVPTDSPLRQMILLVSAADRQGTLPGTPQALPLKDGPTIPDYGGIGDPDDGYYAGLPGKIYAKILRELWTGVAPTGAYWNMTRIASDNRIPAFGSDTSRYVFQAPEASEAVEVSVTLLFRRAFIDLMDQKGWDVPDIVMETQVIIIP